MEFIKIRDISAVEHYNAQQDIIVGVDKDKLVLLLSLASLAVTIFIWFV